MRADEFAEGQLGCCVFSAASEGSFAYRPNQILPHRGSRASGGQRKGKDINLWTYPLRVLYSSRTRLVTMRSRCQLTLLTLFAFGVAWSRDWTMTSKLRVVEFGVGSSELTCAYVHGL
jgi:hypothetical protein